MERNIESNLSKQYKSDAHQKCKNVESLVPIVLINRRFKSRIQHLSNLSLEITKIIIR